MTVDREINLASVYRVVWERGKRILMVTVVTMIVAFAATLTMTKRYAAIAELEVKPSRVGERAMDHWITPVDVYERYFVGDESLQEAIRDMNLDQAPYNIANVDQLASRINVSKMRESTIIRVYAEMETPEMAADVANMLCERAIEKNLNMLAQEANTTIDLLDRTLSARIADNASRENIYLKTQQAYTVEIWQKYLDNIYSQWQKHLSERENLIVSCRELEIRVESLQQAMPHQPEKFLLDRTLSEDLTLLEAIRKNAPDHEGTDLTNLSLTIESPNPEHYTMLLEKDRLQAQLDGDRAKLTLIETLIPQIKKEIDEVQNRIYVGQMEVARSKAEYDRSYEIFGGIDKEHGWAPTTVFSERYDMAILNRAIPKDRAVRPNRPAIVLLGGSLAFLAALAYFLLRDLYGIAQRSDTAAEYGSTS